jgi:hypothetical protein
MGLEQMTKFAYHQRYVSYTELTETLRTWAGAHQEYVRLTSLATTDGGRDVWLLEIGKSPDRLRPSICIDGNMHSAELLTTNATLHIAEMLIQLHSRSVPVLVGAEKFAADALYYIIPRVTPDGAEEVLRAGRLLRSVPRRRQVSNVSLPFWVRSDLDADGTIRQMRFRHPSGEFVSHPSASHVLVPRTIDDAGPFYKVVPEGYIEGFDGVNIPFAHTLSDNDADFNRNFPFDWSIFHDGAGPFPGAERETRALIEFASKAPHIFAWLNLHTFGGVLIRPPFSKSTESDVHREDMAVYEYIAEIAERLTGMPTVSAIGDMTPSSSAMTGTLASWAYGDRACFAWAVELWDLFASVGLRKRSPYFRNYSIQDRDEIVKLVDWDTRQNGGRVFHPWRSFRHYQLGEVEIGGINPLIGFINPPESQISGTCAGISSLAISLAAFAPRLEVDIFSEPIADSMIRITLTATNGGYLPTFVSARVKEHEVDRLNISIRLSAGELVSGESFVVVDHLGGWGRGVEEEGNAPFFQKSQAVRDIRYTWVVCGSGSAEIGIGNRKIGWVWRNISF